MSSEQDNVSEINFLQDMCEAIKVLDKDVQLFIAQTYLKPEVKKEEVKVIEQKEHSDVTFTDFYKIITDEMKIESHEYALQLYGVLIKKIILMNPRSEFESEL